MYASWNAGIATIVRPATRIFENTVLPGFIMSSRASMMSSPSPSGAWSTWISASSPSIDVPRTVPSTNPVDDLLRVRLGEHHHARNRHESLASSRHASSTRPTVTTSEVCPPCVDVTS